MLKQCIKTQPKKHLLEFFLFTACGSVSEHSQVYIKTTIVTYVCVVTDVPNAPQLLGLTCNKRDASLSWKPMGDNRSPILRFTIQYNTTFTPDVWEVAFDSVPSSDLTYTVSIAYNSMLVTLLIVTNHSFKYNVRGNQI